jgi:large subunit ribosomal protein L25
MQHVEIQAEKRIGTGKKAAKALRADKKIPAVIYSKNGTTHITTTSSDVKSLVYTSEFKLAKIECDGKSYKSLLKDITFHPVTDEIVHIDFLELIDGHPIKVEIPVNFTGTSPGVKAGGKLIRSLRGVKIKANPENLVDQLSLDISSLELGQSARVRDIKFPAGVESMTSGSIPVANIEIPRALKSAATAAKKEEAKKK